MRVIKNRQVISMLIVLSMFIGSFCTVFAETPATQEWIGWLIDLDCVGANPKTHTQNCNLMPDCIASGEGIYVYTTGKAYNTYGSSDWLPFDGASQGLAKQLNSILSDPNNSKSYLTKYLNRIPTIKVTGYPVTSGLPQTVISGDYGVYSTGIHITSIEFYYISNVSNYEVTSPENVVLYEETPTPTSTTVPANTNTSTPTSTKVPANTNTPTPTSTPIPTSTVVPANTNTSTPTSTKVPANTNTPTPTSTAVPANTNTSTPTSTKVPANTSTPTPTSTKVPANTNTPTPTSTTVPANTNTPTPTSTTVPANTNTPTPTSTPTNPTPSGTAISNALELKGWLIDADCSGVSKPASHTTSCLKMPSCLASGLGILVLQPDATYKFYKFDAAGHKLAEDIVFSTTKENNVTIAATGSYSGEIFTVKTLYEDLNAPTPIPYQDIIGILYNISDNNYGIKLEQPDGSYISYTLDEGGNKLVRDQIAGYTAQKEDVLIKATGYFKDKTFVAVKVQDYQEFIGWITTQNAFSPDKDASTTTKQYLQTGESIASGYGIAVKAENNGYKFYPFDENGNKLAANVIKAGTDGKGVRILVNGHLDGNTINVYQALRERNIPGILVTKSYFDEDKPLKNLTKAYLLKPENEASGYGYYVNSCGGYEFFPFDNDSHNLVKNVILNSGKSGRIKLNLKGFYYWRDRTIKVTEINEDTTPDTVPVSTVVKGYAATRNYYVDNKVQQGVLGEITKEYLLSPENIASGYGIIYKPCCRYGYYRTDAAGEKLIADAINNSKDSKNIKLIVKGTLDVDFIKITSVIEDTGADVQAILTGSKVLTIGENYNAKYSIKGFGSNFEQILPGGILAQDVSITYDSSVFDFVNASSLLDGVSIIKTDSATLGTVRVLLTSQGPENALTNDSDVVSFTFKAKAFSTSSAINVKKAILSDKTGAEYSAQTSSLNVSTIIKSGDINGDGKVTIGDLAIISYNYRKTSSDKEWNNIKIADVNDDNIIDIQDLAFVASKIL